MTKDDIIRMAREANLEEAVPGLFYASVDGLERFAAHEREECAKVCDVSSVMLENPYDYLGGADGLLLMDGLARTIRARGNQ